MASIASRSSSASSSNPAVVVDGAPEQVEQRPQAGPLPAKAPRLVGEIGYQDISEHSQGSQQEVDLGDGEEEDTAGLTAAEVDARNGRHPADRSNEHLASQSTMSLPNQIPPQGQPNDSTTSLNTTAKRSIFSIRSFTSKSYGGVTFPTYARLVVLSLAFCGLITAWIFAAMRLTHTSQSSSGNNTSGTSAIFIHVAFAIIVLIFLIFLERTVFQLRAERYAYLHPGEILPSHRHRTGMPSAPNAATSMPFAPWNRPPLPTYAAALGHRGTGDVEDQIIAAPPPPAYGNTRGSTLLLANLVRASRGSHRVSAQGGGDAPWQVVGRPGVDGRMSGVSTHSAPPISYDEVEHRDDLERAQMLEAALAKLEDSGRSSSARR